MYRLYDKLILHISLILVSMTKFFTALVYIFTASPTENVFDFQKFLQNERPQKMLLSSNSYSNQICFFNWPTTWSVFNTFCD